jgi:signal transduction histidine kinase
MERLNSLSQEQRTRASELELLRRFVSSFAESPDLQSTVGLLTKEAHRLGKPDSIAIFLVRDGRLEPVSYHPLGAQRRARSELANLKEPVVEQCLREGGPTWKKPGRSRGGELLPASEHGVAFPLGDFGALYLGWRAAPSLPSESLRSLLALVELSSVAIETATRLDKVRRALDYHYSGHTQARAWLERFDVLLAGVRSLAGHFTSDQVLDTLRELALRLVVHDHGVIVIRLADRERVLCWPSNDSADLAAVEPIGRAAIERQQPVLLEPGSGFAPVWGGAVAHLAAPVMADQAALGVIVVARNQGAFERADQESLALAAVQTAIMLDNCRLYEEVLDAKARLEQSQAQLVQSSKLAAVGQLAAGVAHELNTPLGAILLRIDTARRNLEKNDPLAADKKLQSARDALLAARDIVSKLLTYSATDSRQMAACDLGQVVGNALALVEAQLAQQNVKVRLAQSCSARLLGHANELTQVVVNLLLNARDAILSAHPEGQIQIRSELSSTHVRLEVEDSGPGMPDEIRPRIFDPFFTTKPVGSGTGLGLWISHQIVETHGGRLTVAEGPPTRFVLELPLAG